MDTYTYKIGNSLYINLTNQCTNACTFCIRRNGDGLEGYHLWMDREPTAQEVIDEIPDPGIYSEIVFCGYGEPTIKLEELLEVARYIKSKGDTPVRLNTNGHASLIHNQEVPPLFAGLIDTVSISLNAADAQTYCDLCEPQFGPESYEALLEFARACKEFVPEVILSAVDIIGEEQLAACKELCDEMGVKFRAREMIEE